MRKIYAILLFIFLGCSHFVGQENDSRDSVFFSFVHLKHGDVYVGEIIEESDSLLTINEQFIGVISLKRKKVSRIENVYRNTSVIITLGENVRYTGNLVDVTDQLFTIKAETTGEFSIPRDKIKDIQILEGQKDMANNPNATRYFFAPSAIPIEKGKGYYQNAYLLSNSANFGVTKNFSVGGGVIIPLLFYATPKVGFKVRKNFYLGVGAIAATTIIPDALISGGIPYGLMTVGNMENNFTIGAGYGFIWNEGDFQKTYQPIVTLNGMTRISNRIQLVSENWFIPYVKKNEYDNITYDSFGNEIYGEPTIIETQEVYLAFSAGMRILLNKNTSLDFAPLLLTGTANTGIVVPYLDFVYKF